MSCQKCLTKNSEFRLVSKKSFRLKESSYIELCMNCMIVYSDKNENYLLLLPTCVMELNHYLLKEKYKDISSEIKNIPHICSNIESTLYKFWIFLGIDDCVINCEFNQFMDNREEFELTELRQIDFSKSKQYLAIYDDINGQIISILDDSQEGVQNMIIHKQSARFDEMKNNTLADLEINIEKIELRDMIRNIIENRFIDVGYFLILPVIENAGYYDLLNERSF